MPGAATIAIVTSRLRKDLRILAFSVAACALLAYLQRNDDAAAQLAGCLVFTTLIGVTISLLQRGIGRLRELELCEQAAPLYGRELARATALVPCVIVSAGVSTYWIVAAVYTHPIAGSAALTLCASNAATLTAMSATVRTGIARIVYVTLACSVSAIAFAIASRPIVLSLAFCIAVGFIALRQYGESLARYDPI